MRFFLVSLLENPACEKETVKIALKLLLKIGSSFSHPELLVSTILHMLKHKVDLSKEIELWSQLPEVYELDTNDLN